MTMSPFSKILLWMHLMLISLFLACGHSAAVDIHPITALDAKALIENQAGNPNFVVLDIRTPKEYNQGHIAGSVMLDYYSKGYITGLQKLDKSKTYLIYCRTGNRSGRTLKMIKDMGFSKIYHLNRGIVEWYAHKLPLVKS